MQNVQTSSLPSHNNHNNRSLSPFHKYFPPFPSKKHPFFLDIIKNVFVGSVPAKNTTVHPNLIPKRWFLFPTTTTSITVCKIARG